MKRFLNPGVIASLLVLALLVYIPMGKPDFAHAQAPAGLNPVNVISTATNAANTAGASVTLGDITHFTNVCGFSVSGLGATTATGATVTLGPVPTTMGVTTSLFFEYSFAAGTTVASTPTQVNFTPCLPIYGIATLTVGGAAGNTQTNISMWGYKQ